MQTLRVVYEISLKAGNLAEALHYCHDYLHRTLPVISIRKSQSKAGTAFILKTDCTDEAVSRYVTESVLSVMAREMALISGNRNPVAVFSPYCNSSYPGEWRKGKDFRIVFKPYEKQLQHFESMGLNVMIPEYLQMVGEFDNGSFLDTVKRSVLKIAQPTLPDLKTIAYALNITTRTLQRRLTEESTSFRQICDELKCRISDLLLLHKGFDVADISAMLGYSEPAAYIHAVLKWHGRSPTEVRNGK